MAIIPATRNIPAVSQKAAVPCPNLQKGYEPRPLFFLASDIAPAILAYVSDISGEARRGSVKAPLGQLLTGVPGETMVKLKLLIERDRPPVVITVGDIVSTETLKAGIPVNLRIVDYRSMREPVPRMSFPTENTYWAKNSAGGITMEAWQAVKRALEYGEAVVVVDGEEDLLALPAIVESPNYAFVVYGQPSEGVVVVTVSSAMKKDVSAILKRMSVEETDA